MGSEWNQLRLDEVTQIIVDCPHSTPKWTNHGVIVLRNQNIRDGKLDLSSPSYTNEEGYKERIKRGIPSEGDIIFTREAPMGEVCQIPRGLRCCLGQRMVLLRANTKIIDSKFLLFTLQSPYLQHQISWNEGTGTTVSNIRIPNLKAFRIPTPPVPKQKAIAHILGSLDDKIELNRQMNATLESMAQAMFKSWFVDFDPVIDNALTAGNPIPEPLKAKAEARKALGDKRKPLPQEIQELFPSRFVFTEELGWIPEGWGIGCFGDIAQHIRSNVKAENVGDSDFYIGLEHIGKKQLFLTESSTGKSVQSNKSAFQKRDLLFGKLRPYFHKVCLAPCEGTCSTDILVFRAKQEFSQSYVTLTAFSEEFVDYANMRSTGTRMPRASAKDMLGYAIMIPNKEVLVAFEDKISPIWTRGMKAVEVSKQIECLRDTLLPKLISGQLRLPDSLIDKFAEQADSPDAEQIISEAI